VMVSLRRIGAEPYEVTTDLVPLEDVAHRERPFPREWINGTDVSKEFRAWAAPLVGEVPPLPGLEFS